MEKRKCRLAGKFLKSTTLLVIFIFIVLLGTFAIAEGDSMVLMEKDYISDPFKVWKVRFNHELNFDTVSPDFIYIEDDSGNVIDFRLYMGQSGDTVHVDSLASYNPYNNYYINVKPGIKSLDNKELKLSYRKPFVLELYDPDGQVVIFPDSRLEGLIREKIGKPTGPIRKADVIPLTDLDISNSGITSLEGIQELYMLESLDISDNMIEELIMPKHFASFLKKLDASNNNIKNLDAFYNVMNLEILDLSNNQIEDIGALKFLTKLNQLNISKNKIRDISSLANITNLTSLFLADNPIADFKYIKSIYNNLLEKDFDMEEMQKPINVSGIVLGDRVDSLISRLGQPDRIDLSGKDYDWYIYNSNYKDYIQIGVDKEKIVSVYSARDSLLPDYGIGLGMNKSQVESIFKDQAKYDNEDANSLRYIIGSRTFTFYFDKYKDDELVSIWVEDTEYDSDFIYLNNQIVKDFEKQVFDLANIARVQNGREPYLWNEEAANVARIHSQDMAHYGYTGHYDSQGRGPWARAKDYNLDIRNLSENVASGYLNPIEVHHGWMESEGHRENIITFLKELGVGIAYYSNENSNYYYPFYTQLFVTPSHYEWEDEEFIN